MERRALRLPPEAKLTDLKVRQSAIVEYLRGQGESYDSLAELFGLNNGGTLRAYVTRKPAMIKSNNRNIKLIHAALVENGQRLQNILPSDMRTEYLASTGSADKATITYLRRPDGQRGMASENLHALFQIAADVFRAREPLAAIDRLRRVCGRYYAYRSSAESNVIVKSYLEISEQCILGPGREENSTFFQFKHWHPDRIFDPEHDAPRQTRGIVFYLNNNIYLLGSTEAGQAVCIFTIREPIRNDFRLLAGFTLTTNMDHVLFSARTIFVKDGNAADANVARIHVGKSKALSFKESEKFDLKLLKNSSSAYLNELISKVRL